MKSIYLIAFLTFVNFLNAQKTWQDFDRLSQYHLEKGHLDSAKIFGLKQIEILESKGKIKDTIYANACQRLVPSFENEGNFKECYNYLNKARTAIAESIGKKNDKYRRISLEMGHYLSKLGEFDAALKLYLELKEYDEQIFESKDPRRAQTLKSLGIVYLDMNQFDKAYENLLAAKNIEANSTGKETADYAHSCFNLGMYFTVVGDYDKALENYKETKAIRAKVLGKTHPDYAAVCSNIGGIYRLVGDYQNALKYGRENLEILENTGRKNHFDYAIGMANLGQLYVKINNYEKALEAYREEKEILKNVLGEEHLDYAYACGDVGLAQMKLKNYDEAQKAYELQREIMEKVVGTENTNYAYACVSLGVLNFYLENNEEALDYYEKAQEIYKNKFGVESRLYSRNFLNLAMLYDQMKNNEKAIVYFDKAISSRKKKYSWNHPKLAYSFLRAHQFYTRKGDLDLSENYLKENLKINKARIKKSFSFTTEQEQVNYIKNVDQSFRSLYAFSNIRKEKNPEITAVTYDNLLMHKGLLLKSSTRMRFAILSSGDPNLIQKYQDWMKFRKKITKEQSKLLSKQNKDLKSWKEKADQLERELAQASSVFADENSDQSYSWKKVQKHLKKNELAIEFVRFNAGMFEKKDSVLYAALIVNQSCEYPIMVNLFKEKDLVNIYQDVTGSDFVKSNSIYGSKKKKNSALYKLIWAPIEKYIPKGSKVYYSPDGILHRVSFAAIGSKDWYLSDNYSIQLMSTTAIIGNETQMNLDDNLNATLIGGVKYNSLKVEDEIWSYLPGTSEEINSIKFILDKNKISNKIYSDTLASEENIKKALPNSMIAHISTHGYFYPDPDELWKNIETTVDSTLIFRGNSRGGTRGFGYYSLLKNRNPMMRSGLALAKANEVWNLESFPNQEDGVLTAREVSNLELQKMKLVVLSACETGLGDINGAEGVYGLQRAFKIAGVNYIVMSLWQVPDRETKEFMEILYDNLISKKLNIRLAFEKTQNAMKSKYDPYFWAAFVLIE